MKTALSCDLDGDLESHRPLERERWLPADRRNGHPGWVGRFNHFENGSIYWTPAIGPHEVHGLIRDFWAKQGWERGPAARSAMSSTIRASQAVARAASSTE